MVHGKSGPLQSWGAAAHLHGIAHEHGKGQQECEAPCKLRTDDLQSKAAGVDTICGLRRSTSGHTS